MLPVRAFPTCVSDVTDIQAGPVNVNVIASPSGSDALMPWSAVVPAASVMLLMGLSVGGRSTLFTVIVNVLSSVRFGDPLSVARTVAEYVPASSDPGARWMLPVVMVRVVTVIHVGPDTFENVSKFPSGSVPVMTWSAVSASFTVMFAG